MRTIFICFVFFVAFVVGGILGVVVVAAFLGGVSAMTAAIDALGRFINRLARRIDGWTSSHPRSRKRRRRPPASRVCWPPMISSTF